MSKCQIRITLSFSPRVAKIGFDGWNAKPEKAKEECFSGKTAIDSQLLLFHRRTEPSADFEANKRPLHENDTAVTDFSCSFKTIGS